MNYIEIALSFLEGLALIASPCILPILPLMLGASVDGGRKRPFGIITGFVLAFTAFAMLSRQIVNDLGIDLDIIKYGSLALLAFFGIILLSEKLSAIFNRATGKFANLGSNLTTNSGDGFFSGIFIGMLIGLIWTPCAGPILAAVLVQIIRQESDAQALFLVGAFAIGAGLPMFIISLTGRKIMSKLKFLTNHAETLRKSFGVLILVAVGFMAVDGNAASFFSKKEIPQNINISGLQNGLENPYPAPQIVGIEKWLNSDPLTLASLKGKVVLIDFWTYSCVNCVRTLPYITKWNETYRDKGLVIIGIHAPEFEFEKNAKNVENALMAHGIKYPVALDNRLDTWTSFKNKYWPAHYLIDQKGDVVYTHFGEGNYAETENNIRHLLDLKGDSTTADEVNSFNQNQTPETYLGYLRSGNADHWALEGKWNVEEERIVAKESGAKLQLNFTAKRVFLVLGSQNKKPVTARLKLNGKVLKKSEIIVTQHQLYELVNQENAENGLLEITASEAGLEAYAFTFGN
ncbi:MAG: cytochrome c biogenesis protein DipZ [Proteobacteria bacterium]|nr:cytochrome c biogenesis protein DipZ [Pseudomonadota bacterium]